MDKQTQKIIQNCKDNITNILSDLEDRLIFLNDLIDFVVDKKLFTEFLIWRAKNGN